MALLSETCKKRARREGPSDFGGGINRGHRPGGVPVGASRWRCRTTDVVRGRSFLPHFAPVRGGSWSGAWEPTAQTLEGSKKNTHATVEKVRDAESVRIRERTGESAETGTRIDKRGQDAQKVYLFPSLRVVPGDQSPLSPLRTPQSFATSEVRGCSGHTRSGHKLVPPHPQDPDRTSKFIGL